MNNKEFEGTLQITKHTFNKELLNNLNDNYWVNSLWPLVYIISDDNLKKAYVGETTNAYSRMSSHLSHEQKAQLKTLHLITCNSFNKSATLDIEANLIKYISGDGAFTLLNGNAGLANHNYYQNDVYKELFKVIWEKLKEEKISKKSLAQINNTDLFKFSPYKSLNNDQRESITQIIKSLLNNNANNILIEGGAGTGKTILAIFLFKLLNTDLTDENIAEFNSDEDDIFELIHTFKQKFPELSMALVIPMSSLRTTLKKVFKNIDGLNSNMVIGPSEVAHKKYDILIVDEAHRLRKRVNLGTYFSAFDAINRKLSLSTSGNELDWVLKQSKNSIFFYDEDQSIKPSDVDKQDFDKLKSSDKTIKLELKSQFRVLGGVDYIKYIDKLLNCKFNLNEQIYSSDKYEFKLFDSLEEFIKEIKNREIEYGLSRVVAGYSWKWESNKKDVDDINIDNVKLKWNSINIDWINSDNSKNEVGCIHTTQGYDLNYTGVIFGNEISYDPIKDEIIILPENYYDKNGKNSIKDPNVLKKYITNIYKTMMLRGIKGTYIYVCDKNLKEYFSKHIAIL